MLERCIIKSVNLKNVNQKGFILDQDSDEKEKVKTFNDSEEARRWIMVNQKLLRPDWAHTIVEVFIKKKGKKDV